MPNYTVCDPSVTKLAAEVLAEYHADLEEAGVTFTYLFAHAKKEGEPALKFRGYQAAAVVRINSLQDRVEGMADCTIVLDGDKWDDRPEAEQRAIMDHEFSTASWFATNTAR